MNYDRYCDMKAKLDLIEEWHIKTHQRAGFDELFFEKIPAPSLDSSE